MNKTLLIAGGTAVVSLAVGAAGGYLFAKKRFDAELPGIIEAETGAIKKYHAIQLMEARNGKPNSPADIRRREDEDPEGADALPDPDELDPEEETEVLGEEDRAIYNKAQRALTDYGRISTEIVKDKGADPVSPVTENVFDRGRDVRPARPPRGPDGKFRPRTIREQEHEPPEIIDEEDFLLNDPEHNQESLLYFVNDRTLVLEADTNESVDINLVGEVNLTLFPQVKDGEPCVIFVRNTGMTTDYEIKRTEESLTAHIGLAENADEDEENLNPSAWV